MENGNKEIHGIHLKKIKIINKDKKIDLEKLIKDKYRKNKKSIKIRGGKIYLSGFKSLV